MAATAAEAAAEELESQSARLSVVGVAHPANSFRLTGRRRTVVEDLRAETSSLSARATAAEQALRDANAVRTKEQSEASALLVQTQRDSKLATAALQESHAQAQAAAAELLAHTQRDAQAANALSLP